MEVALWWLIWGFTPLIVGYIFFGVPGAVIFAASGMVLYLVQRWSYDKQIKALKKQAGRIKRP